MHICCTKSCEPVQILESGYRVATQPIKDIGMNVETRGIKLQKQLWSWYLAVTERACEIPDDACGEDKERMLLQNQLTSIREAGWRLTMTEEGSPADKSGIDFIWFHPNRGWFPLDSTAMDKVGVPELIHIVAVDSSKEKGECNGLTPAVKNGFAQLLIRLSETEPRLSVNFLPPSIKASKKSRQILVDFKGRLEALASSVDDGEVYLEWARRLRKAIGFECEMHKRTMKPQITDVKAFIEAVVIERIKGFLPELGQLILSPQEDRPFARDYSIRYHPSSDLLVIPEPQNPHFPGLQRFMEKLFSQAYGEVVSAHGVCDSLLLLKRFFESRGKEELVHAVLDALESKYKQSDYRTIGGKKRKNKARSPSRRSLQAAAN